MRRDRAAAFTLIELLVVIAILSILATMLIPSLQNAMKEARKVVCQSNTRSLQLGLSGYAVEHNSLYPRTTAFPVVLDDNAWTGWGTYGMICPVSGVNYPVGYGLLWVNEYVVAEGTFLCPARDTSLWPAYKVLDNNAWVDCEGVKTPPMACYNLRGWEPTKGTQTELWRIPDQRSALLADVFINEMITLEGHEEGVNVAFTDGAVEFVPLSEVMPAYNRTLLDMIFAWENINGGVVGRGHHRIYDFFDHR